MTKILRRIALSLLGGVAVQALLVLGLFCGAALEVAGLLPDWLVKMVGQFFILTAPGYIVFIRAGTFENPHPGFSSAGGLLAILLNIVVYSVVVYVLAVLWLLRSKQT